MTRMPDQTENMHHSRMKEIPDIHLNSKIHKPIASTSYYPIILQACSIMNLKVKTSMCIWGDYYTHVTYVHLLTIWLPGYTTTYHSIYLLYRKWYLQVWRASRNNKVTIDFKSIAL